jgi:hypothetical protein
VNEGKDQHHASALVEVMRSARVPASAWMSWERLVAARARGLVALSVRRDLLSSTSRRCSSRSAREKSTAEAPSKEEK